MLLPTGSLVRFNQQLIADIAGPIKQQLYYLLTCASLVRCMSRVRSTSFFSYTECLNAFDGDDVCVSQKEIQMLRLLSSSPFRYKKGEMRDTGTIQLTHSERGTGWTHRFHPCSRRYPLRARKDLWTYCMQLLHHC